MILSKGHSAGVGRDSPDMACAFGTRKSRVTLSRFQWAGSSMVEQLPLKQRVVGSSPTRLTTSSSFHTYPDRANFSRQSVLPQETQVVCAEVPDVRQHVGKVARRHAEPLRQRRRVLC